MWHCICMNHLTKRTLYVIFFFFFRKMWCYMYKSLNICKNKLSCSYNDKYRYYFHMEQYYMRVLCYPQNHMEFICKNKLNCSYIDKYRYYFHIEQYYMRVLCYIRNFMEFTLKTFIELEV